MELGTAYTALTLDFITEYCHDRCLNCLDEPDFAPRWKRLMVGLFEALTVNKHLPIVPRILSSLPRVVVEVLDPAFVPFFETQSLVAAQARKVWEEEKGKDKSKVEGEEKPKSIFHGIMQSSLPDEGKTHPRMVDEAFVLIVAGGETTARVTAVTLAHLLQNKSLISRLRKELDKLDIINDLPSSRRLEEIPLMKAIVQEGLRVAAPVTNAAKLIAPNEELECHGRSVPRGVSRSHLVGTECLLTCGDRLPAAQIYRQCFTTRSSSRTRNTSIRIDGRGRARGGRGWRGGSIRFRRGRGRVWGWMVRMRSFVLGLLLLWRGE